MQARLPHRISRNSRSRIIDPTPFSMEYLIDRWSNPPLVVMRIDPAEVFASAVASLPLRLLLAWGVGTLGAFTPLLLAHGLESFAAIGWQALFFPIYLFFTAMVSGWWGFVAVPLVVVFGWKVLVFLRGEGSGTDLCWIFLLPLLITIRASGSAWPFAAVGAGIAIFFVVRHQRRYSVQSW